MTEDDRTPRAPLPPLDTWWPYLSSTAREAVLRAPGGPLAPEVRQELARVVGGSLDPRARLTSDDRRFLAFAEHPDL